MKKLNWNERCIQHGLEQLPVVKDRRAKEDVYERLERARRAARWKRRWLPAVASAVVLAAAAVAGPRLITPERADKQEATLSAAKMPREKDASFRSEASPEVMMAADVAPPVANEAAAAAVIALPDPKIGMVVPVTVPLFGRFAPKEQVAAALDELDRSPLWGSAQWLDGVTMAPEAGDGRVWTVHVPARHRIFAANREEQRLFLVAVVETVRQMGGRYIRFFTGAEEGLELSASGQLKTTKVNRQKRIYYMNRLSSFGHAVLVSAPSDARSFPEAVERMKKPGGRGFEPAIPPEVEIDRVDVNGRHAAVSLRFSALVDIADETRMAEAILLTAKEFGLREVTLAANGRSAIGPYPLGERIKVPAGPNAELLTAGRR
ncbi:UDP-glucose 6-dehydrogenase [Geobacillus subterraneus]|uniref:UDP-glucose 6-dehydrogenase n=2 Tax=Geobacillus TaxID=129337 RepID=A0ABM6A9W1_9BACL|nr:MULTISPECIES: GerMN domain-containing protein [Geobacillus]AMX83059.1 UDP-glucose 6-dehydrogenase [Geobacillus subterraneus]KZS27032.1 UDP-glucose 6-dehydrogenase [Geobacillus subterraneus]OXB91153.1 UDP-glucose 6-dehydrogenase [Geobacillus uzenensis]QIZ68205.1 UDP-glucose 6-dehydrogenase [Geobacillus subterraneus]